MKRITRMSAASRVLVAGAFVACAVAPAGARAEGTERRAMTLEDVSRFREVADPRVSPDGAWVAYTVTTQDLKADRRQTDLWMTSWDGVTTLRLTTTTKESERRPRWSPDGRTLAFLSSRGDDLEADQLWLLPRAGGEAERATEIRSGVVDYAWAPDGARFALVVADSDSVAHGKEAAKDKTVPPILIDRLYFKEDVTGYLTHKRSHLYLFDLATRTIETLTTGDNDELKPAWSPDGKSIALAARSPSCRVGRRS